MTDVEIEHQCYCAENGVFCRYLDKASGLCIATSCNYAQELLKQVEIEKRAKYEKEKRNGYLEMLDEKWDRIFTELENIGYSTQTFEINDVLDMEDDI